MHTQQVGEEEDALYVAPKELAQRWQCSRSSVDRIARRAGMTRVFLGDGVNGMIRYVRKEVERYEQSRQFRATL